VDNLATKVIEVGRGEAPLYPGGYEDFSYWKKQREIGVTTGMPVAAPQRREDLDPLATSHAGLTPRLRQPGTPPARQALERELKKTKPRLSELEKRVSEAERAVKGLETRMAEPGFYDERDRAAQSAVEHQKLMWEAGDVMAQWEALQVEVDEKSQRLAAATPAPRR
jgi:ATP-binding cassette subfamily F protein 3